jgi:hypothetical protein
MAAAILVFGMAGCAGAHRTSGAGLRPGAMAPDDAPLHPNPNAQYTMVDSTPRLVPRPTPEDAASARTCEDRMLSVSEIAANVNGDYRSVRLAFMNRGANACKLGGYPEVALLGSGGEKAGSIAIEKVSSSMVLAEMAEPGTLRTASVSGSQSSSGPQAIPEVILMPHAVAAFQIVWQFGPDCPEVSRIEVTAPGGTRAYSIPHPLTVCYGRIQVTALHLDNGAA